MLAFLLQSFAEMGSRKLDPFALVADELESVSERLRRTILTEIPVLSSAAEYFFKVLNACSAAGGKETSQAGSCLLCGSSCLCSPARAC